MKKNIFKSYMMIAALGLTATACNDFIEVPPTGVINDELAYGSPEKMCTAAYAMLGDCWYTYPFNLWPYGDVASDDAFKGGSGPSDTNYHPVEIFSNLTSTTPDHLDELWYRLYCAVSRCNRAIISLDQSLEREIISQSDHDQRKAEMRFLRGHFYFKLIQLFNKVPWCDENTLKEDSFEQTPNNEFTYEELMGKVIADFMEAYSTLPEKQKDGGRVTKLAAASYLAKCYLTLAYGNGYEASNGYSHINKDYMQKVLDFTKDVKNASDYDYLEDFGDIFLPEYKNSKESVFAVQTSHYTEDYTVKGRANWSNTLNGCWGIWSKGWDFHKPSQNLVNAFKTKNGLPMFDKYDDVHNSYPVSGVSSEQKYDPRLFHTVGMPSWPYKYESEYTMTTDNSRTPNTYGYYTSLKEVPMRSQGETYVEQTWQSFAMNDYIFRYTDVMLMRAEAAIEMDNDVEALEIVNRIRERAANSIDKHISYAADYCEIALYPDGHFKDKETARECLRWERRLEMAMESSRFFDLRRWGMASQVLNKYFETEQNDNYEGQTYAQYYKDAHFTPNKNEYMPVPYNQLYYVPGLYEQNAGY